VASESYFKTDTSPSKFKGLVTDNLFNFVPILLDEFERQKSDRHYSLVFDDNSSVDLGERTLAKEISLSELVLSVFK
jgi:hypothetical protein